MSEDMFKFIDLVENERSLWDITSKDYKNNIKKCAIWSKIGKHFNWTGDETKEKFKGFREKYRREKSKLESTFKSGSGRNNCNNWMYFDALKFLDDCYKQRRVYHSLKNILQTNSPSNAIDGLLPVISGAPEPNFSPFSSDDISQPCTSKNTLSVTSSGVSKSNSSPSPSDNSLQPRTTKAAKNYSNDVLGDSTSQIIEAMREISSKNSTGKFHGFIEFSTFNEIDDEKAKLMERDIMNIIMKYKYN